MSSVIPPSQDVPQGMPASDLRQLQLIQLELLLEVDRICQKCGICYCIIAGTLLGAVRHGGYIPWDDDADVAFLRPEYEKFALACQTELDSTRFYFQDHYNTPGYRWGYGKLRRKDTLFLREGQEHMPYPSGIFIDIFPLDNVPDPIIVRRFHNVFCTCIRKLLWSEVGRRAEKKYWLRGLFRVLSWIPLRWIFAVYERLKNTYNGKPTEFVRILTFPTPDNGYYGYYRRWYENLAPIQFEGHEFPGIRDFDEYLTFKFGDYKSLPPLEQRKTHPATQYRLLASRNA